MTLTICLGLLLPARGMAHTSDISIDRNVRVGMRDGVRLATDIYRPAGAGPWPAVLVRTPYDKDNASGDGVFFAQHGYAYVVQDTRGRFNSEGVFDVYVEDSADGLDSAQWLNRQSWFDAQRGFAVYGESYAASTALSTAEMAPPNLKAAYVSFASANYHDDGAWRDGAFQLAHNLFLTAVTLCPEDVVRRTRKPHVPFPTADDINALFALEDATPLDRPILTDACPWYANWTRNADDNQFWNQPGLNHLARVAQLPAIPIAFVSGWYDQFLGGTVLEYQNAPAEAALTIGPWVHAQTNQPTAGDGFFDASATLDRRTDALQWFDQYLNGSSSDRHASASDTPASGVRYYLMGGGTGQAPAGQLDIGGTWQTAPGWPPPNVQYVPYYLHADGDLGPAPPGDEAADTYTYDPRAPVPTIGGNVSSGSVLAPAGAYVQRCRRQWPACRGSTDDLTSRADVLTFQTQPLDQDLTVVGPLTAQIYASTTAADTDFTAKLVDVYPNGDAVNVADGIVRGRYNDDKAEPHFVTPGTVHQYVIDLWHTAMRFTAGHRLRLDLSSSNFPHYDRNLNTGGPIGSDALDTAVVASQTIFHDAARASYILLPMLTDAADAD